ncbi:MAG TPA: hypothetical protein PLK37_16385 [Terricaulis sp.]|nr:hypothetical protein [Terricaulis sp.]
MNLRQFAPPVVKRLWRRLRQQTAPPPPSAESLRAAADERSRYIVRTLEGLADAPAALNPNLIFDIGMHVGQDSDFYLRKGFNVVAVEANPLLAAAGEKRFAQALRERRLTLLNIGVGEQRGRAEFHVNLELVQAGHRFTRHAHRAGERGDGDDRRHRAQIRRSLLSQDRH